MVGEPLRKLQCCEGLGSSWVSLGASWEGPGACCGYSEPAGRAQGDRMEKERSITGIWWYHRLLSPTGPLPKNDSKLRGGSIKWKQGW